MNRHGRAWLSAVLKIGWRIVRVSPEEQALSGSWLPPFPESNDWEAPQELYCAVWLILSAAAYLTHVRPRQSRRS